MANGAGFDAARVLSNRGGLGHYLARPGVLIEGDIDRMHGFDACVTAPSSKQRARLPNAGLK